MAIRDDTPNELRERILRFSQTYVNDWSAWLDTEMPDRADKLGAVLRKWQACRPYRMRRTAADGEHEPPYLEDLIACAAPHIEQLNAFDLQAEDPFTEVNREALQAFWDVFHRLAYRRDQGGAGDGCASVVGISKACLLLTDGRLGPAFDASVRTHLGLGRITNATNATHWENALWICHRDVRCFNQRTGLTLQAVVPEFGQLHTGRLYDMALGPRGN